MNVSPAEISWNNWLFLAHYNGELFLIGIFQTRSAHIIWVRDLPGRGGDDPRAAFSSGCFITGPIGPTKPTNSPSAISSWKSHSLLFNIIRPEKLLMAPLRPSSLLKRLYTCSALQFEYYPKGLPHSSVSNSITRLGSCLLSYTLRPYVCTESKCGEIVITRLIRWGYLHFSRLWSQEAFSFSPERPLHHFIRIPVNDTTLFCG
jgi:hypothetical protein